MTPLERIKFLRKKNHLTQEQVAKGIGIPASNYCNYEQGKWNFTIDHLLKLADFYNVSVSYLVNNEDERDIVISRADLDELIKAKEIIQSLEDSAKNE